MKDNTKEIRGLLEKAIVCTTDNAPLKEILTLLPPVCSKCGGSGLIKPKGSPRSMQEALPYLVPYPACKPGKPCETPINLQQAITALDSVLSVEDKEAMQEEAEEKFVVKHHHSTGRWIRNNWGLWKKGYSLYEWFKLQGIFHADDMSGIIFTSYYRKVNELPINLQEQIQKYIKYWQEQSREEPACKPAAGKVEEFVKKSGDFWLGGQPKTNAERALTIRLDTACDHLTAQAKQIVDALSLVSRWVAKIEELEGEKKRLKKYARCLDDCRLFRAKRSDKSCNCGFEAALQDKQEEKAE